MRHAVILAGGSGTRLWPLSRRDLPKQLIPLADGRCLLEHAWGRLERLVERRQRWVCAAEAHRALIAGRIGMDEARFIGEPTGRDTLNALALSAAVIGLDDPQATIAVLTSDQLIEPADRLVEAMSTGFRLVEESPDVLVTFGITPTCPSTGFGYLELGEPLAGAARLVTRFREKPDALTAAAFVAEGPLRYLWNSGMFLWKAAAFLSCVERYEPEAFRGIAEIAKAWRTPRREATLARLYPRLRKVSVDYAVMEPASRDPRVRIAALPLALSWRDVGSWSSYAEGCERDASGNALAARRRELVDCRDTLVVSDDPEHLIAAIGCEGLVIVHTARATLVCRQERVEEVKKLQARIAEEHGERWS